MPPHHGRKEQLRTPPPRLVGTRAGDCEEHSAGMLRLLESGVKEEHVEKNDDTRMTRSSPPAIGRLVGIALADRP